MWIQLLTHDFGNCPHQAEKKIFAELSKCLYYSITISYFYIYLLQFYTTRLKTQICNNTIGTMVIIHFPKAFSNSSVFNSFQKTNNDALNMISRGTYSIIWGLQLKTVCEPSPFPLHVFGRPLRNVGNMCALGRSGGLLLCRKSVPVSTSVLSHVELYKSKPANCT